MTKSQSDGDINSLPKVKRKPKQKKVGGISLAERMKAQRDEVVCIVFSPLLQELLFFFCCSVIFKSVLDLSPVFMNSARLKGVEEEGERTFPRVPGEGDTSLT